MKEYINMLSINLKVFPIDVFMLVKVCNVIGFRVRHGAVFVTPLQVTAPSQALEYICIHVIL